MGVKQPQYPPDTIVQERNKSLLDALLKFQVWQETGQAAELTRLRAENERLRELCRAYITTGSVDPVPAENLERAINVIHRDAHLLDNTTD